MNKDLITQLPRVDQLFDQYAERFGKQQTAYRNHVYRLVNLVMAQRPINDEELGKLQVAAFFHDAGFPRQRLKAYGAIGDVAQQQLGGNDFIV